MFKQKTYLEQQSLKILVQLDKSFKKAKITRFEKKTSFERTVTEMVFKIKL